MKHLASCWRGDGAQDRLMNILSPQISEQRFLEYVAWAKGRGCNTWHLALNNQGDGEGAGYCLYGRNWDWIEDPLYVAHFLRRMKHLRNEKFTLYGWDFMDQSEDFFEAALKHYSHHIRDLRDAGILKLLNVFVPGLELNEYANLEQVKFMVKTIRRYWNRRIGTHQTSDRYDYAKLSGVDICLLQTSPGKSPDQIKSLARAAVKGTGKPVVFFELDRHENRELCEAALSVKGIIGAGNW